MPNVVPPIANTLIRIGIIHRSWPREALDEQGDAGLDGAGLHGDADEAADDEDEERDVDGAEQLAAVEDVDVAVAASSMPYRPLIGACSESMMIRCGF